MREVLPADSASEYVSYEDYLRIEEASDERHEYIAGALFAMVGETKRHNLIIGNMLQQFYPAATGACRVFVNHVKLRTADDIIYYPDIVVSCDPHDTDPLVVNRPCLVVEVLSPSTSRTDRREKLLAYRAIDGLQAYLIVGQDTERVVRHWWNAATEKWDTQIHLDDGIPVPCLDIELSMESIYRNLPETNESEQ
jgi:Uma2 family endonuclease